MAFHSTVLPPEAVLSTPAPRDNLYQKEEKEQLHQACFEYSGKEFYLLG